jgi:hypothetical protein
VYYDSLARSRVHAGQRLEERQLPYVMAVACSEMVTVPAGSFRADELAPRVPAGAWQRLSCADGSKGSPHDED